MDAQTVKEQTLRLAKALLDLGEGRSCGELVYLTGLSVSRCKEICEVVVEAEKIVEASRRGN